MLIIPMQDFTAFREEITLEETPYIFRFKWNTRDIGFWFMDIFSRDEELLICGVKLVLNFEIISKFPDRGLPLGQLYVVSNDSTVENLGRYDFVNGRASLVYITEAEIGTI